MKMIKIISSGVLALFICVGCGDEKIDANRVRERTPGDQKIGSYVSAVEQELESMPQKLEGGGWTTMHWSVGLAKSINALEDCNERNRLTHKLLDAMSQLLACVTKSHDCSMAFCNYESMMEACMIFADDPEISERFLDIMCDCIRIHDKEVKKWADAISNEPNRRARIPMKNIHGCLASYFEYFTNQIERTYFPWMKEHGLPAERHEHWRRKLNAAYEMDAAYEMKETK